MTGKDLLDWWPLIAAIVGWIIVASVGWTKMTERVNGQGGRIKKVEDSCAAAGGRMDSIESQMAEFRSDAKTGAAQAARTEKAVEDLKGEIQNNHLALGSQLHSIERLIQDKDKSTSNRLVRIETIQKIEQKVGPIPED